MVVAAAAAAAWSAAAFCFRAVETGVTTNDWGHVAADEDLGVCSVAAPACPVESDRSACRSMPRHPPKTSAATATNATPTFATGNEADP